MRREFFVGRAAEAQREEERETRPRTTGTLRKRNKEMRVEFLFPFSARKLPEYTTKRTLDVFKQLDAQPAIAMPRVSEYAR